MELFGKKEKYAILAPMSGKAVPVTETPDKVFSGKVLGDGVTMLPESGEVFAPVGGTVVQIAHSYHALCIKGDEGAEILVHLGIDTVELDGEGFACHVKEGDHVEAGQKLMDMDLKFIESRGYNAASPCIVTNSGEMKSFRPQTGVAEGGKSIVIFYKK